MDTNAPLKPDEIISSREAIVMRDAMIWDMRQRGRTQRQIAEAVSLSQTGVLKSLRRTERRVLAQTSHRVELVKARQSGRIEHLYSEAMTAWEASKRPSRKTSRKTTTGEKGGTERKTERTSTAGDPRFLQVAIGLLEAERKIWGLDQLEYDPAYEQAETYDQALGNARAKELERMGPDQVQAFKRHKLKLAEAELARLKAELEGGPDGGMEAADEDQAGADPGADPVGPDHHRSDEGPP